jgi:hypothetical protein
MKKEICLAHCLGTQGHGTSISSSGKDLMANGITLAGVCVGGAGHFARQEAAEQLVSHNPFRGQITDDLRISYLAPPLKDQ